MLKDLFLLDRDVIFLNHGSFGACPRPVFKIYQEWQARLERQPVQFLGVELDERLRGSRQVLGEYLGAPAEDIVYVSNATHGVNIVAHSLPYSAGDEILSTDQEYGACDLTWEFICDKTGARYKRQPIQLPVSANNEIVEQLWHGVTPKTKVIFLSHITSPTSLAMPIAEICKRAREAGIITLIDGAHAPGQIPINLTDLGVDFYTGNCHKWMMSPKGAGFLYARPEMQHLIEPLIVSWGYQSKVSAVRESRYIDYLQWTGTKDPAAALSVPAAIEFMQAHQWDRVQAACHSLVSEAIHQISAFTGMEPLYPIDSDFYYQMGTIPIPKVRDLSLLKAHLYGDYKIEIPCIDWNGQHFVRISVQGYNSEHDVDQLIQALSKLLPEMKI